MPDQTQPDAGVADGTVLTVEIHPGVPNAEVEIHEETVVYDANGWHKEAGS
jgi:hypothetical protein